MKISDGSLLSLLAKGDIEIDPKPGLLAMQPCSIDLMLGTSFRWINRGERGGDFPVIASEIVLDPGDFVLATTREKVTLSKGFMGEVHGKSSWARFGLLVHAAGLVDPGFTGTLTLEMFNMSSRPLRLRSGHAICQITFERLDFPAVRAYGDPTLNSHYQEQVGATAGVQP